MNLHHVKLINGTDILAIIDDDCRDAGFLTLHTPIEFKIDMNQGPWMQSYLLLSSENSVRLVTKDILFVHPASEKAIEYFNKFMEKMTAKYSEEDTAQELYESSDDTELTMEDVREALNIKTRNKMN